VRRGAEPGLSVQGTPAQGGWLIPRRIKYSGPLLLDQLAGEQFHCRSPLGEAKDRLGREEPPPGTDGNDRGKRIKRM
jgi:hypothetical protein